ncbi:MAG: phosphodiester glycosidase family protein [Cyanobacteria bacterium J06621_3]
MRKFVFSLAFGFLIVLCFSTSNLSSLQANQSFGEKIEALSTATNERIQGVPALIAQVTRETSALFVHSVTGSGVKFGRRNQLNSDLERVRANVETIIGPLQKLRVDGDGRSEATLGFINPQREQLNSPLVAVGRSDLVSFYYYKHRNCDVSGEFVIGWSTREIVDSDVPICEDINHSPGIIGPGAQSVSNPVFLTAQHNRNKSNQPLDYQRYIDATAPVHLHYYCSAVDYTDGSWGVALSERPMIPTTLDNRSVAIAVQETASNTCRKAIQTCEERGGQECSVINEDHWKTEVPDNRPELKDLNLFLNCDNNDEHYRSSGIAYADVSQSLLELEAEALSAQSTSCSFSAKYFYELLISPISDERTLIHTSITDEGYVIDELVGSIKILPAGDPETTEAIELNAGDRFFFDYLVNSAEKQPKESIPNSERQEAANHPLVKTFLDTAKWPDELAPEIQAYNRELQEQFIPPVSAELLNVSLNDRQYQLWKATVNLSNSDLAFSLVRDCDVTGESSFSQFSQDQRAALVMGGIFGGQDRCDPTNFPLYSEGRLVDGSPQDWTQGTVFSIRPSTENSDDTSVMTADIQTYNARGSYSWSSNEPDWGTYLFAVTSGPRLLANGQVVYSSQAASDQGHSDRNVVDERSRTQRAALCLSRDKKEFYYTMLQDPPDLGLREFSNVIQSSDVGCWDAVNLDGGAGPALAVDRDVKNAPGRQQPYFMVVYYAEDAPPLTRNAWSLD